MVCRFKLKKNKIHWSCSKKGKTTFTPQNKVNLFIAYELDTWSQYLNIDLTLKDCLFGTVKADPDKYSYSVYGTEFDSHLLF